MKKFIKNFTKALCLLFVFSFTIIAVVGCGKNNNSTSESANNTASTTIGEQTDNSAENVNQGKETQEPQEVALNGIYKLARPIIYADTYWTISNEEVFDFFDTTDINGVYNALRELNFLETVNANIYEENGTTYEYMVGFIGDYFNAYVYDSYGFYKLVYTCDIDSLTTTIEIIDETTFNVHAPVVLTTEDGTFIETPIFVKMPFVKVINSENILLGKMYSYETGSAKIELTNNSTMTEEDALIALAEIFGIPTENIDIAKTIELELARYNVQIDNLLTKLTLHDSLDDTFIFEPITDASASVYGIEISITGRNINLSTGVETINLEIVINDNATLTFAYQAV